MVNNTNKKINKPIKNVLWFKTFSVKTNADRNGFMCTVLRFITLMEIN